MGLWNLPPCLLLLGIKCDLCPKIIWSPSCVFIVVEDVYHIPILCTVVWLHHLDWFALVVIPLYSVSNLVYFIQILLVQASHLSEV